MTKDHNYRDSVAGYAQYVEEIERVARCSEQGGQRPRIMHLDGEASDALRRLVPLKTRKAKGIFFTPTALAKKVAQKLGPDLRAGATVCDPACGAGALLTACAEYLPLGPTLAQTARNWSNLISGSDLFPEFERATRVRLILAAAHRHNDSAHHLSVERLFPNIITADALSPQQKTSGSKCIVVNPPFQYIDAPKGCVWGSGRVQLAALFVERLLTAAPDGQRIVALLPEVLRSGARYRRWREYVQSKAAILDIDSVGRFDQVTDIDVFILDITVGHQDSGRNWAGSPKKHKLPELEDLFDLAIGPLVPFRWKNKGPWRLYLDVIGCPPWEEIEPVSKRRFDGTVTRPPFVVIRRTSSPTDRKRVIGSLVTGARDVAVENHLIVLKPKDGTIDTCRSLLHRLADSRTDDWLNKKSRCRHISLAVLRQLPWWSMR